MTERQKALSEWSKWLIAINFSAATGCIIKFTAVGRPSKFALIAAICIFTINVILSVVVTLLYSIEHSLLADEKPLQRRLAFMQLIMFLLALVFLFAWVF